MKISGVIYITMNGEKKDLNRIKAEIVAITEHEEVISMNCHWSDQKILYSYKNEQKLGGEKKQQEKGKNGNE
ncbi:hypothetical protein DRN97_04425 [Methanosarcinales archaeon]|nr:MAG: hypothetical protein DRN97_04425 [Methanosarcinales archaeon]